MMVRSSADSPSSFASNSTMRNGRLMIVFTGGTGHLFNAHREAPGELC